MLKYILSFFLLFAFLPVQEAKAAGQAPLAERLKGRILLQVQSYGRAWYVYPKTGQRYYLRDGNEAFMIMRELGLGITSEDLAKIPSAPGMLSSNQLVEKLKGYILLAVEERGEAWYVNPADGLRYYLKDGQSAFEIMRQFGLGITDDDLRQVPASDSQIAFDGTFNSVAYTSYSNGIYSQSFNGEQILPLASLTKLMTAMVLLETPMDWNKTIEVTQEQIDYPKSLVGDDKTSEIDLQVGDKVKVEDLWLALLISSSNQAAVILADASGFTRREFVNRMNEKADELGLEKTVFFDMSGLDAHNISTPKEYAVVAHAAFLAPEIAKTSVKTTDHKMQVINKNGQERLVPIINRNKSLSQYNPDGVKTGYLVEAQRNLVLKKGEKVIVIMHARSMNERNEIIETLF